MKSTISKILRATALLSLTLSGCSHIDPLERPYMWHASGINALNIAAMAANPADLTRGHASPRHLSRQSADGVDRVWTGKVLPLVGGSGAAGGGGGGGGGAGGAGG